MPGYWLATPSLPDGGAGKWPCRYQDEIAGQKRVTGFAPRLNEKTKSTIAEKW